MGVPESAQEDQIAASGPKLDSNRHGKGQGQERMQRSVMELQGFLGLVCSKLVPVIGRDFVSQGMQEDAECWNASHTERGLGGT